MSSCVTLLLFLVCDQDRTRSNNNLFRVLTPSSRKVECQEHRENAMIVRPNVAAAVFSVALSILTYTIQTFQFSLTFFLERILRRLPTVGQEVGSPFSRSRHMLHSFLQQWIPQVSRMHDLFCCTLTQSSSSVEGKRFSRPCFFKY
jgi:hypothetical protein